MKILQLFFLTAFILSAVSCGNDEEPLPNIRVGFNYLPANPVAGDEVAFTNASTGGSSYEWDFGDGTISTDENPTHVFESNGTFPVTLVVDGYQQLAYTEDVIVGHPSPTVSFTPDPIETGVEVTFTADIYNPTGANVDWAWDFPAEGWISDDLDETGAGTGQSVTVTFTDANPSMPVGVTATIGSDEMAATENFNVSAQLAKTLWIAQKGGNILSKQLFSRGEAQLDDTGISSGSHPLTMDFANDRLFVFDAGEKITWAASETVPGSIFSFSHDLSGFTTHLTFSTDYGDDAFFGSVDGTDIIFTDRRNDITVIPTSTENAQWGEGLGSDTNPEQFPRLVQNNELAYYSGNAPADYSGPTYGWGALNGTVKRIGDRETGVYWWAKNSTSKGLYRFSVEDIGSATIPEEGAILGEYAVRAFEVDQENSKVYFSSNMTNVGFYVAGTDGSNPTLIDDSPADAEGGASEPTFITDVVVDNEGGYVYWAYRGPEGADLEANPLHESGIKRYKLDGTGEVEYFIKGVEAYGLALDNAKR